MEPIVRRQAPPPTRRGRRACVSWGLRLGVLLTVLAFMAAAASFLYFKTRDVGGEPITLVIGGQETTVEPNQGLNPAERAYLRGYLTLHAAEIQEAAGADQSPVTFVVKAGETANDVAQRLEAGGIIADATLFRYYLRYYDLDSGLEAGEYTLQNAMTRPELAQALSHAAAPEIEVRITEGWRLEQIADYLRQNPDWGISAEEFSRLALRLAPPGEGGDSSGVDASRLETYPFLAALPANASLEGYLFPDTYRLPLDATAADLINTMLFNFSQRVTAEMRQAAAERGLTLHGAITLASIVEREAQLPEERPVIAGVFLNRLAQGIKLDADPSVQYALGFQAATEQWWKRPLFYADLEIDSPYNTYLYPGLSPGPIASPGLASIEAVIYPAETEFLFFVVDCTSDTPGAHVFAITFEEHQVNVARCQ